MKTGTKVINGNFWGFLFILSVCAILAMLLLQYPKMINMFCYPAGKFCGAALMVD